MDLLGLTAAELSTAARRSLASGAGLSTDIYRMAHREGRFAPEMLPLGRRSIEAWRAAFQLRLPKLVRRSEEGQTIKAVLRLEDGLEVEIVRVPMARERFTLCVSSQVGCKLACGFCETAKMGLLRNMTAAEIVSQLVVARSVLGWDIHNVVFMGMGEPLDNADQVLQALRIMNDDRGLAFGQQRLNVCTAGEVPGLRRLRELGWKRLGLSVSLNAATDAKRNRLMPVNRRWPLAELQSALLHYRPRDNFVFRISYCLIPDFNDALEDAEAIATWVRPLAPALVNVIPYNPGTRPLARAPAQDEVDRFVGWLEARDIPVKQRVTKGRNLMAACGQLGNLSLRKSLRVL